MLLIVGPMVLIEGRLIAEVQVDLYSKRFRDSLEKEKAGYEYDVIASEDEFVAVESHNFSTRGNGLHIL